MYRGYTGHEHLYGFTHIPGLDIYEYYYGCDYSIRPHDALNLINMNGRLYDPVNGRMLSVDNYVQESLGSQGHNRYTYAGNNPLKYTDPSGELIGTAMAIGAAVFGLGNLAAHAIRGDVTSFGKGLKYFVQGAIVGATLGAGLSVPILGAVMKGAGVIMGGATFFSVVGSVNLSIASKSWTPLANAGKLFLGNFYLDENKQIGGAILEGVSRFSWQILQTTIGYSTAQVVNGIGNTEEVGYFGGATFSRTRTDRWGGITLGNNISIDRSANIDIYDPLTQHEYGHYIQSQIVGPLYLFTFGLASAIHASHSNYKEHIDFSTEQDANARSLYYLNKRIWADNPAYGLNYGWNFKSNPINKSGFNRHLGWFW